MSCICAWQILISLYHLCLYVAFFVSERPKTLADLYPPPVEAKAGPNIGAVALAMVVIVFSCVVIFDLASRLPGITQVLLNKKPPPPLQRVKYADAVQSSYA